MPIHCARLQDQPLAYVLSLCHRLASWGRAGYWWGRQLSASFLSFPLREGGSGLGLGWVSA